VLLERPVRRGQQELEQDLADRPSERVRLAGAGRPPVEKNPAIEADLQELVEPETAGNPMNGQKWVRSSLRHLSGQLKAKDHRAVPGPWGTC
jgi:hypothetical protein